MENFIGCNIRFLRKQRQLSQCELAQQLGLSRGNIASYEKNIAEPRLENLIRLAEYFQININDLIARKLSEAEGDEGACACETSETAIATLQTLEVQTFQQQLHNFDHILKGFRCYHNFRMSQIDTPTEEVKLLATEIERLLKVSESVVEAHRKLLELVAPKPK